MILVASASGWWRSIARQDPADQVRQQRGVGAGKWEELPLDATGYYPALRVSQLSYTVLQTRKFLIPPAEAWGLLPASA